MPRLVYERLIEAEEPVTTRRYRRLYGSYARFKKRCGVAPEWAKFATFARTVGLKADGYRLTRPDKSKPLGPDNWAWCRESTHGLSKSEAGELDKDRILMRRYNMTYEEYCAIGEAQNWVCAICKKPSEEKFWMTGKAKRLCVDHCHKTGRNRGLLCGHCNRALGKMQDSKELLEAAIEYLNKYDYTVDT